MLNGIQAERLSLSLMVSFKAAALQRGETRMQFIAGVLMFAFATSVLGWLANVTASGKENFLLRGELVPSLVCVMITAGIALGLILMVLGGAVYIDSVILETATIIGLVVACGWTVAYMARTRPMALPA